MLTAVLDDVDRLDAHRKRYANIPECQRQSMTGRFRVIQPAPSLPPATIASPTIIPSPDRTLPLNRKCYLVLGRDSIVHVRG